MSQSADAQRVLITGGSGQVGGALIQALNPAACIWAPLRAELDLALPDSIRAAVREFKPHWIVNAGAYTAVDKAESDSKAAFAINAVAPGVLGEEAAQVRAGVLHFSTDYVFDGMKPTPYCESDTPGPLGVYGASKLAGEQALAASGAAYVTLRTSWVYGSSGKNFLLTILRLARERETLRIVADQHGAPTWNVDLAHLANQLIQSIQAPEGMHEVSGVYHATCSGETTWAGFAEAGIRQLAELRPGEAFARVESITTADYPTPAQRPRNSRLDCTKLNQTFGFSMPEWRESLRHVVAQLRG